MGSGEWERRGDLTARVSAFAAHLRVQHGFLAGPGEAADALRALGAVDVLRRAEVRDALRAVLIARREEAPVFDREFARFFRTLPPGESPDLPPLLPQTPTPPSQAEARPAAPKEGEAARPTPTPADSPPEEQSADLPSGAAKPVYERAAERDPADFATLLRTRMSPEASGSGTVHAEADAFPELLRAAGALVRAVRLGRARRLTPQPRGPKLDARRTLRAAARTAGDAATLRWLGRPRRSPRFLIVLDGSRSMGGAATRLLRFAQALGLRSGGVEVYTFSTGLTRLTPLLRRAAPGQPLTLPDLGEAWGGGTRIGENLLRLARDERARVTRDTLVLILSDGLDTGDVALVDRALRDLRRRAGGVVWLSPLAALPGYRPVQRAIVAALPHLDALLPADSVSDLHALPRHLSRKARSPQTLRLFDP